MNGDGVVDGRWVSRVDHAVILSGPALRAALDCVRITERTRKLNALPASAAHRELAQAFDDALAASGQTAKRTPPVVQPLALRPTVTCGRGRRAARPEPAHRPAVGPAARWPARRQIVAARRGGDRRAPERQAGMDDIVRSTLIRVLASLTDAEFTDVVEAARGDDYTPSRRDYDAVVAELQAQEQPQRRAAIAEQIRSLVQKGG